jgi:hypothetical protein
MKQCDEAGALSTIAAERLRAAFQDALPTSASGA